MIFPGLTVKNRHLFILESDGVGRQQLEVLHVILLFQGFDAIARLTADFLQKI